MDVSHGAGRPPPAHLVKLDNIWVVQEFHELDLPVDLLQITRI